MKRLFIFGDFQILQLNKFVATKHLSSITNLANMIPLVHYTDDMILAEFKEDRLMFGKWEHSLAVFKKGFPVAILITYERSKDEFYPRDSLYISELVVHNSYRRLGLASILLETFLHTEGFRYLSGDLAFSVQTNSAPENKFVIDIYKGFGFREIGFKNYDNRKDAILFIN